MNKTIPYLAPALLIALAALIAAPLAAQPTDRDMCPPQCNVTIDVPENPDMEPDSWPVTLEVQAGEYVTFVTNVPSRVVFTGRTPFVNDSGRRLTTFRVGESGQIRLRVADSDVCSAEPGCKYMIIDDTDPGRPARDPYIIVRR